MGERCTVEGTVENVIFQNEENGYTVLNLLTDQGEVITVVGCIPCVAAGEGMTVSDCLAALDGTTLQQMLSQPEWGEVVAALPKFELEGSFELSEALEALGMTDAFDANLADFSALGSSTEGNLFLNRVLHRTYLSVAEKGTRAGAVTVVEVGEGAAAPSETHYITLDRPFICMLVDTENGIPFFMGTVMDVGK